MRCAISEAGVPKEQVTSAPTDSEEAGDDRAGTSAAPTMWLGAQNGWSVSYFQLHYHILKSISNGVGDIPGDTIN